MNLHKLGLLVMALLLSACSTVSPPKAIERLVVFGDSNVDAGNLYRLSESKHPAPPNWQGRNSNGPLVVEYLAQDLGAKLHGHAVSGATSGPTNIAARIPALSSIGNTGLSWQLDEFFKTGQRLGESDLVIIWAGSNDLFGVKRADTALLTQKISEVVTNIRTTVNRLRAMGAQRVIIATRTPREQLGNENDLNGIDLNQALARAVQTAAQESGIRITVFDAYGSVADMMRNPGRYGFTEVNALCVAVAPCAAERYEHGLKVANSYVNWDAAHKTTRVHRIMADQLLQTLGK